MHGCDVYCQPVNNDDAVTTFIDPKCSSITNSNHFIIAKGDSVATDHYWREQDREILHGIKQASGLIVHFHPKRKDSFMIAPIK